MGESLKPLRHPPIVEVACGMIFEAIPQLDPMLVGRFWSTVRGRFPRREIKPLVSEALNFTIGSGVPPVRCWLRSEEGEYLIQIQPDRFYFNWCKRGDAYPRFGSHESQKGVLAMALDAFEEFASFCEQELKSRPLPKRVELTKIDDVEFDGITGLSADLPIVEAIRPWTKSERPEINVRIVEEVNDTIVMVNLSNVIVTADLKSAVRVETRASMATDAPESGFLHLNSAINEIFFSLFSKSALARFSGGG